MRTFKIKLIDSEKKRLYGTTCGKIEYFFASSMAMAQRLAEEEIEGFEKIGFHYKILSIVEVKER